MELSLNLSNNPTSSMSIPVGTSSLGSMVTPEALENAAKEVDRQLVADRQFPELSELINASQQSKFFLKWVLPVSFLSLLLQYET